LLASNPFKWVIPSATFSSIFGVSKHNWQSFRNFAIILPFKNAKKDAYVSQITGEFVENLHFFAGAFYECAMLKTTFFQCSLVKQG
jgi:hypothetical protein